MTINVEFVEQLHGRWVWQTPDGACQVTVAREPYQQPSGSPGSHWWIHLEDADGHEVGERHLEDLAPGETPELDVAAVLQRAARWLYVLDQGGGFTT